MQLQLVTLAGAAGTTSLTCPQWQVAAVEVPAMVEYSRGVCVPQASSCTTNSSTRSWQPTAKNESQERVEQAAACIRRQIRTAPARAASFGAPAATAAAHS